MTNLLNIVSSAVASESNYFHSILSGFDDHRTFAQKVRNSHSLSASLFQTSDDFSVPQRTGVHRLADNEQLEQPFDIVRGAAAPEVLPIAGSAGHSRAEGGPLAVAMRQNLQPEALAERRLPGISSD